MAWKPQVKTLGDPNTWSTNALVFATREEAEASARELFSRWFSCIDHGAVEVDAEATHAFIDGENKPIAKVAP
jgi:hypothetical protein